MSGWGGRFPQVPIRKTVPDTVFPRGNEKISAGWRSPLPLDVCDFRHKGDCSADLQVGTATVRTG